MRLSNPWTETEDPVEWGPGRVWRSTDKYHEPMKSKWDYKVRGCSERQGYDDPLESYFEGRA